MHIISSFILFILYIHLFKFIAIIRQYSGKIIYISNLIMNEFLIKNYISRITTSDIDEFAKKHPLGNYRET